MRSAEEVPYALQMGDIVAGLAVLKKAASTSGNHFEFPLIVQVAEEFTPFMKNLQRFSEYIAVKLCLAHCENVHGKNELCSVCLHEMLAAKKLSCQHIFHAKCLQ